MAKEKSNNILDDLINEQFTEMKDLSKEDTTCNEFIDSGNYAINYCCSRSLFGAYAIGQINALYGESGVGKSMLPMIAAKDPKLSRIIVIDSEGSGSGKSLAEFVGAPLEKIRYMSVQTLDSYRVNKENGKIEEVADKDVPNKLSTPTYEYHRGLILVLKKIIYALEYSKNTDKNLIIVDSLSNMKSVRAALLGIADVGKTNVLLNQLFSSLDNALKTTNTTLIFAGKVYTNINAGMYGGGEGIMAGGGATLYNSSLTLMLTALQDNPELADADLKSEKERRKTGLGNSLKTVRVRVKKSRFGTEGRNCWVILDAAYGLTRYSGLFQLLYDFGICVKTGSRYSVPGIFVNEKGEDITFYKKDFVSEFIKNEKEYLPKLQEKLQEVEEKIKQEKLNLTANDLEEAFEDSEDSPSSLFDMARVMEAEADMVADALED